MSAEQLPPARPPVCFSCREPGAFPYLDRAGITVQLCPKCTRRYALWDAAAEQLRAALLPALLGWRETWGNVPGIHSLPEALEWLGRELEQELKDGTP